MYLSSETVLKAINVLRAHVHPFIGITFIACKHYGLSVGSIDNVSLDQLTRAHMDKHHRIDRRSDNYFQPFKGSRWWVADRYPSTGLQTINTQTFGSLFIHPRTKPIWGFETNYLDTLEIILKQQGYDLKIPTEALAVWLYKDKELGHISDYRTLVNLFFKDYNISNEEKSRFFVQTNTVDLPTPDLAFILSPPEMTAILRQVPEPPDAKAEGGRTITSLSLMNAGPARNMNLDFGQRLSIVTGDNGLGKSFLLDFTWWAATGSWADREALPAQENKKTPTVKYTLRTTSGRLSTFETIFDVRELCWIRAHGAITIEALAVFSRADGSFAIADPIRKKFNRHTQSAFSLSAQEIWNGKTGILEGLIRDWVRWQSATDQKTFDQFVSILKRLSPEDLGTLTPGPTVRLPGDPREIPTIKHQYGTVPVTHASSGVQRVLLLAYLIIWSWQEHELSAQRLETPPLRRMMVLIDELEAHLHPKWQRIVLPALMSVGDLLSSDLALQVVAATHSPMILASMEATFDPGIDVLYHLYGDGPDIKLEQTPFIKYGDASGWLTSPLFGLRHARSRGAELAIEEAKSLQLQAKPNPEQIAVVSEALKKYLAEDDKFWPRWLYFAEQHGVTI